MKHKTEKCVFPICNYYTLGKNSKHKFIITSLKSGENNELVTRTSPDLPFQTQSTEKI